MPEIRKSANKSYNSQSLKYFSDDEIRWLNFDYLRRRSDDNAEAANHCLANSINALITAATIGLAISGPLFESFANKNKNIDDMVLGIFLFSAAVFFVFSIFCGLKQIDINRIFRLERSKSFQERTNILSNRDGDLKTQLSNEEIIRKATNNSSSHIWWEMQKGMVLLGLSLILLAIYRVLFK